MSRRPVCQPGSLSRLAQHECYAKLAAGVITTSSVRLEPSFFDCEPTPIVEADDGLAEAARALRLVDSVTAPADKPDAGPHFLMHMHQRGHRLLLNPSVLAAAWQVCVPATSRNQLLGELRIEGLESLPSCWLVGLVRLFRRHRDMAEMIRRVTIRNGVLWPEQNLLSLCCGAGAMGVPEILNMAVYPSLWRPLKRRHLVRLQTERPDLREELQLLSDLSF